MLLVLSKKAEKRESRKELESGQVRVIWNKCLDVASGSQPCQPRPATAQLPRLNALINDRTSQSLLQSPRQLRNPGRAKLFLE